MIGEILSILKRYLFLPLQNQGDGQNYCLERKIRLRKERMRLRIFKYLESYFLPCFWGACFVVNEIQLSPNLGTVMIPTNPSNQFYMILAKTGHVSFRSKVNANLLMLCPSVWIGSIKH